MLQLPKIKSLLPIVDIENLLKPLLNDAEIELDDESFDRVVIVLSNLIDRYRRMVRSYYINY